MNDILIIVDMQKDFIDGSLGSIEAQQILPNILKRIRNHRGPVFYTLDTHHENYLTSQEGHHLPITHCLKESEGWALHPEIEQALKIAMATPIEKNTFGAKELIPALEACAQKGPITSITLAGLCTDICVISNALLIKAWFPEVPIYVDAQACAGVSPSSHQTALDAMRACQISILNT